MCSVWWKDWFEEEESRILNEVKIHVRKYVYTFIREKIHKNSFPSVPSWLPLEGMRWQDDALFALRDQKPL